MITPDHIHTGYELGHDIKREERQVVITVKTKIKVKSRHLIGTIFLSTRSCCNQNTVHNLHWNYFTNYTQIVKTSHSYVIKMTDGFNRYDMSLDIPGKNCPVQWKLKPAESYGERWGERVSVTSSFSLCHGVGWTLIHSLFSVCKLQPCIYSLAKLQA